MTIRILNYRMLAKGFVSWLLEESNVILFQKLNRRVNIAHHEAYQGSSSQLSVLAAGTVINLSPLYCVQG